jgi:AcrR family transcriptional regulator
VDVKPKAQADGSQQGSRTGLPASIEAAWGLREPPRKGPKPGLTLARIVAAAVDVAATEGLASLSMKRVAAELGASTMALYRYVAAKDELLALMVDAAIGTPPPRPGAEESWRAGLSRWSWAYLAVLSRHSWALRVPITGPQVTPNLTAWIEDGLRSMRDTGLAEPEKLSVILLLSGYVRNAATLAADMGAGASASGTRVPIMPTWGGLLAQLTEPEDFPSLHAALASGVFDQDDDPEDEFAFGLERVLDGIDTLVRKRTGRDSNPRQRLNP